MSPHLQLAFIAELTVVMAHLESVWIRWRIRSGKDRKLPHRWMNAARLVSLGLWACSLQCDAVNAAAFIYRSTLYVLAVVGICGPLHGVSLNLWRGLRWYYLGPLKRTRQDSEIDTTFIALASGPPIQLSSYAAYSPFRRWLPMVLYIAAGLLLSVVSHYIYTKT
jgi:hypothetical protein